MAKAIGIGGLFLHFEGEKEALHQWYAENLELEMSAYGSGFLAGEQMMLLSFKRDFENAPLINFRVDDLAAIMERFKGMGLETDGITAYAYGKFAHFTDPFGNFIELWEPDEEEYRAMVNKEIESYRLKPEEKMPSP